MKTSIGTKTNPCTVTNATRDQRRHKYCLCSRCGLVARCTPRFDYWTRAMFPSRLLCDTCFKLVAL